MSYVEREVEGRKRDEEFSVIGLEISLTYESYISELSGVVYRMKRR